MTSTPFVKWAGGKRKLVPTLASHLPSRYGAYLEPFVGGGALFFGTRPGCALLADANERLVRTYAGVRDNVETVIDLLTEYPNERSFFQGMRERSIDEASDAEVAAWFIYLNKTSFNGLYRVNTKNRYNTPFGKYTNPTICNADNLRACSSALQGASLTHSSFEETIPLAKEGDVVYCDPPYVPTSVNSFVGYTADGFGSKDHRRLRDLAVELERKGVYVLISNSAAPAVIDLYSGGPFHLRRVTAARNIAANSKRRGSVTELLISNYPPPFAPTSSLEARVS